MQPWPHSWAQHQPQGPWAAGSFPRACGLGPQLNRTWLVLDGFSPVLPQLPGLS